MATLNAVDFAPEFSSDSGTTWKTLICVKDWSWSGSTDVNKENTFCAVYSGLGTPKLSGTASAVCDTAPSSSQVSNEDALGWFANKTAIQFRSASPAAGVGTDFYIRCSCYITSFEQNYSYGNKIGFTIGWDSDGALDITP